MKRVLIILVCLLYAGMSLGQIDSTSKDPFVFIDEANLLTSSNVTKALDYAEKALELALVEKNKRAEAYCYNTFGSINYSASKYDLAIENFKKAYAIFKNTGEEKGIYLTQKYLAQSYEAKQDNTNAIKYYEEFVKSATAQGKSEDVNEAKEALGRLYYNEGKYDLALAIFELQKQKAELSGNSADLATACNNIGMVYDIQNDTSAALSNYRAGLTNGIEGSNPQAVWGYYDNVNNFYGVRGNRSGQIKNNDEAIQYYTKEKKKRDKQNKNKDQNQKANDYKIQQQQNSYEDQQIQELNTNLYQSNLNQAQGYLEDNEPFKAIPYIKNSIDLASDIGALSSSVESYEALVSAYEQVGDYDKALDAFKQLVKSRDSLNEEKTKEKLFALKLEADLYDRDKRIDLLQREAKVSQDEFDLMLREKDEQAYTSQIFMYSLLAGLGILLISFFVFIRGNREKKKANKLLMLKSLRTQMNPHFIFNSLNSVNSFISQSDERSANKYLSEFSRLMRMVLENSKYDFVSLSSELKTLELYLGLEHLRFKDKFDYDLDIDVISTDEIEVPPMLVQPYIENAVWHGLRYSDQKGILKVSCKESADDLRWTIEDNGIGREKSKELKTKHQKEGKSTGMKNIEERLRIIKELYGQDMELNITDLNPDGTGTRVELVIPKRTAA